MVLVFLSSISEIIQTPNPYIFDGTSSLTLTFSGVTDTGGDYNFRDNATNIDINCNTRRVDVPSCVYVPKSTNESQRTIKVVYLNTDVLPIIVQSRYHVPVIWCK